MAESTPSRAEFAENVLEIVQAIPPGRVMTYDDIAAVLGSRASRMVGQVMSRSGGDLPWWRVIRAGGHPPLCHDAEALEHYEAEGTPLLPSAVEAGYRIDYRTSRWTPPFD
ncbi:MGMT family protein [Homoserinimonas sp. OAct 916]|uniref:MGMT family protein n=1 Tax=Homoserinimonas sp. OAct 916 TaxID=2211450 RepID=UPI000DBEAB21|nr:MGMT family protein [Homoserinimonas sp. OAct 916]